MDWEKQLEEYEHSKDWKSAIELMQKTIKEYTNDVEAYVRIIYLLHNILVEEDFPKPAHDHMAELLKGYFDESYKKFSDNIEYLFFIGKILYIAEWYFGINDDFKPIEERQAFKMQKRAHENEPKNILFEWAYRFSLNDPLAGYLANQILLHNKENVEWLKSKGFPGAYILRALKKNSEEYKPKR